ncbi:MAG: hypothetical protein E7678_08375, partial [Ruminococcaceae bacterium]|nr:hypothetical protein [Oscillospiraceae bacterium]
MKKILALILAFLMIFCCFVSCDDDDSDSGKGKDKNKDNDKSSWLDKWFDGEDSYADPDESSTNIGINGGYNGNHNSGYTTGNNNFYPQTPKPTDEFGDETFTSVVPVPELDFKGKTLTILHRDQLSVQREWYKDEDDGEKDDLDEAIAMRNELIASELNVDVQYVAMGSSDYEECLNQFSEAIMSDVSGQLHTYDIVANYAYAGAQDSIRDCLANLADKDLFPYFDFSLPCWNQSIVNTTKINNKLFYIT